MAENLFRVTVDETNFSRVLGSPPDRSILNDAKLANLHGSRLWAQKNNEKGQQVYDAMAPDDGLLFYKVKRGIANDEGMYVGTGRVGEKFHLENGQAQTIFRTPVATLAYIVTDYNQIGKTIDEVETILGYGSYPQSSHRVADDRYSTVERALQAISQ